MNNNRNNRRRGRGNRNQSGGGNQLNRIDSRARGNAPQLLDKYKKLAQDTQHNGDRVQAEYYLQFADHYFRVIADNKARQDEARAKRNEGRGDGRDQSSEEGDTRNEDSDDGENRRNDRRGNRRNRGRQDEGEAQAFEGEAGVEGDAADASDDTNGSTDADAGDDGAERKPRRRRAYQKDDNRAPRARKPRSKKPDTDGPSEIDSSVLPPAIGADSASGNDEGDALEAVG